MPEEIKRLNYYDQQFLREPDFTDEQKYHNNMRRRLNRSLHTTGVVEGLVVTKKNDQEITIFPGIALDGTGREIVLADPSDILIDVSVTGNKFVTIKYTEEQTDPPPPEYMISEADRTRWTESSLIEVLNEAPADPDEQIILAELTIDNNMIEEISNGTPPNHRRVTGESSVLEYVDRAAAKVNERIYQDRRQFVPLLAFTLKGVEYRDGRNATIITGDAPRGVAFDGTHIWVGNIFSKNLNKIDVITNAVVATVALGEGPSGIAYDGTHIWVTSSSSDTVFKINATTNTIIATIPLDNPGGIAFDGSYIWIANYGSHEVSKIDVTTNAIVAVVSESNFSPAWVTFDGNYIWVSNTPWDNVIKIDVETNTRVATVVVGDAPGRIAFDGAYIWVANYISKDISKIDVITNAVVATVALGNQPSGIAFDGTHIWVASSNNVSKINVTTNTVIATIALGDGPEGIAFDGSHIWVARSLADNINKILV